MYFTSSPCRSSSSLSKYDSFPSKEDDESPISRLNFKENGSNSLQPSFYKVVNATVFTETTNTNSRGPNAGEGAYDGAPVINCADVLEKFNTPTSEKSFSEILLRCQTDLDQSPTQSNFHNDGNSKQRQGGKKVTGKSVKLSKKDLLRI